jgi:hypothetical protein
MFASRAEVLLVGNLARESCLMQNLYDLLGVHPDDDAENLRKAFREAAKASHPDHHGDDPEAAALQFRQITQAYDTLRDAAKRAAYDELLDIERRPLRAKLKRTLSELKRHIVTDAIVAVVLTIVLASGYEFYGRMSETPINEAGGMTSGELAVAAAAQPAGQSDAAGRGRLAAPSAPQMPVVIPLVSGDDGSASDDRSMALEVAKAEPVPDSGVQPIEVVRGDNDSEVPIGQAATKANSDEAGKNQASEPPDPQLAPSGDVPISAPEKHQGGHHPPLSGVAAAEIKRESKTPEPAEATAGDTKRAEMRGAARPSVAARRRLPLQQASLESRNACTGHQSCAGDRPRDDYPPPVFGVGF